ncbi:hypothetical protein B0H19DRAFT_1069710 [Mycena capillaripes]|nr:hypothetical protein B0H19DRAFT_1069710 [Mycena capillaripes]
MTFVSTLPLSPRYTSPRHNDDSLLAQLSNGQVALVAGHNDTNAAVTQLRHVIISRKTPSSPTPVEAAAPTPVCVPACCRAHCASPRRRYALIAAPAAPTADMQAALTAAFRASLNTFLATSRRGREDDDLDNGCNVPDAPNYRNDLAREVVFNPVHWKSNINNEWERAPSMIDPACLYLFVLG